MGIYPPAAQQLGRKHFTNQGDQILPALLRSIAVHVTSFSVPFPFFQRDRMYFWSKKGWHGTHLRDLLQVKFPLRLLHKQWVSHFSLDSLPCAVRIDWVTITSASRDVLKVYPSCWPSVRKQLTKRIFLVWVLRLSDRGTHSAVSVMEVRNTKVEKQVTPRTHMTDPETHH